jgi:hypothetical protein
MGDNAPGTDSLAAAGTPISMLGLSSRPRRCLAAAGITTVEQLLDMTEAALLRLPTFGANSLREVRDAIEHLGCRLGDGPGALDSSLGGASGSIARRSTDLLNHLREVAAEAASEGVATVGDLFGLLAAGETTSWLTASSAAQLRAAGVAELAGERANRFDWRLELLAVYDGLDDRSRDLLDRRLPAPPKPVPSLEDLAADYGITRERARQVIEKERVALVRPPVVVREVHRLTELLSVPCTAAALRSAGHDPHDLATRLVAGIAVEQGLLPRTFSFRAVDFGGISWWVTSAEASPDVVLVRTLRARPYGVGPVDEVAAEFRVAVNVTAGEDVEAMVEHAAEASQSLRLVDGRVSLWTGTHADLAVQALACAGKPMTTEELAVAAERQPTDRGFANALSRETTTGRRIIRTAEKTWALPEWDGVEEYQQLVDVMRERIAAHGGRVSVRLLQREIPRTTSFAATSVQMTATMNPHFVCEDGVVWARSDDDVPDAGPPSSSKVLFRVLQGEARGLWAFDVPIDYDLMYRSSMRAPGQVAQMLGLGFGADAVDVSCGDVTIPMSWKGIEARIFSRNGLKDLAVGLGADNGDRIRFTVVGPLRMTAERLPPPPTPSTAWLCDLIGCTNAETLLDDLTYAVGLDGQLEEDLPTGVLLDRLAERGNHDIRAALLRVHPELAD